MRSGPRNLDAASAVAALDGVSTVLLDCDGVLWSGEQVLPGVPAALAALRVAGKRLLFLTNNSNHSRRTCAAAPPLPLRSLATPAQA